MQKVGAPAPAGGLLKLPVEKWRLQSSPAQDLLNGASPVSSQQAEHYIPVEFALCPSFILVEYLSHQGMPGFLYLKDPKWEKAREHTVTLTF